MLLSFFRVAVQIIKSDLTSQYIATVLKLLNKKMNSEINAEGYFA